MTKAQLLQILTDKGIKGALKKLKISHPTLLTLCKEENIDLSAFYKQRGRPRKITLQK